MESAFKSSILRYLMKINRDVKYKKHKIYLWKRKNKKQRNSKKGRNILWKKGEKEEEMLINMIQNILKANAIYLILISKKDNSKIKNTNQGNGIQQIEI